MNTNTLTLNKAEYEDSHKQPSGHSFSLTEFSNIFVELTCVDLNREILLQLNFHNCLEDVTQFLLDQKIIGKNTEVNYLLLNGSSPVNTLWTLQQIMETFDLQNEEKLRFMLQVGEESYEYGKFQKKREVCCKC